MLDQPSSLQPHWLGPDEHTGDILLGKRKKSTKLLMIKLLPVRLVTYFMFQIVNIIFSKTVTPVNLAYPYSVLAMLALRGCIKSSQLALFTHNVLLYDTKIYFLWQALGTLNPHSVTYLESIPGSCCIKGSW